MKKIMKKIINFFKLFHQKRKARRQTKKYKSQPMGASIINPNGTVINIADGKSVLDVDLINGASEKDKKKVRQYTKCLVTALSIMACLWISMSYVLSYVALIMYGNAEPLSSLSEKVCEVIIGVVISYAFKSYLESYSSAKHDLDMMKLDNVIENKNDEAVG